MANKLYFLIGLPRSGKSTISRKWSAKEILFDKHGKIWTHAQRLYKETDNDRVVVTPDRWRQALGHRYNWFAEPVIFSQIQVAIRALLYDYDVLLDDTHTSRESIKRILEVDPYAIPVVVDTSPDVCKERASLTNQKDLHKVIDRMYINIAMNYGPKFEKMENFLNILRAEVLSHSSMKVVV